MSSVLIDAGTVREFLSLVHSHVAAAVCGAARPVPAVLHLCSNTPDDQRFFHSAFHIGDVDRMVENALLEAENGRNVYIEPRLVAPGLPSERGRLESTRGVFAVVGDSDADSGKRLTVRAPATITIETSPKNRHHWYLLSPAVDTTTARDLGKLMRDTCGGDKCSGVVTQPYRIPGTPNYAGARKRERGRVTVPTRIVRVTGQTFTATELASWFASGEPSDEPAPVLAPLPQPTEQATHPGYCRGMARSILRAEPGRDRSADFMRAVRFAILGGMSTETFEEVARGNPNGCAGKYQTGGDRLRAEIERAFAK